MSENDRYYEIFNNKLTNFIDDLIIVFPNDNDFKLFKNTINLVKLANNKLLLKYFKLGVNEEFQNNILNKNENFFLDNNYRSVLDNSKISTVINKDNVNDKLIEKLKEYWTQLNDDNIETVWNYFNILLQLSKKIN
jgi:hypothetical protein